LLKANRGLIGGAYGLPKMIATWSRLMGAEFGGSQRSILMMDGVDAPSGERL
jgi:hypothetical protein